MMEERMHFAPKESEKQALMKARIHLLEVADHGDLMRPSSNGNDPVMQGATGLAAEVTRIIAQIEKLLGY